MSINDQIILRIPNNVLTVSALLILSLGFIIPGFNIAPPNLFVPDPGKLILPQEKALIEIKNKIKPKALDNFFEEEKKEKQKITLANSRIVLGLLPKNIPPKLQNSSKVSEKKIMPKELDYNIPIQKGEKVPRIYLAKLPDLKIYKVKERKKKFIQILLPLILRCNEEILSHKKSIKIAFDKEDRKKILLYARKYNIKTFNSSFNQIKKELELKVQIIPVEIALAQAAVESGWGLSRFSVDGNALYGQWTWDQKKGIIPINAKNKNIAVKSFPDLISSVRQYMLNINTHRAYKQFRENRLLQIKTNNQIDGKALTKYLKNYAETGSLYTDMLNKMINQNKFSMFNNLELKHKWFWE